MNTLRKEFRSIVEESNAIKLQSSFDRNEDKTLKYAAIVVVVLFVCSIFVC
jgi:hypothetical protein